MTIPVPVRPGRASRPVIDADLDLGTDARLDADDNDLASAQAAGREAMSAGAVAAAASVVADLAAEAARIDIDAGHGGDAFPSASIRLLHERGLLGAALVGRGPSLVDAGCRLDLLRVLAHVGRGSLPVGRLYEGHVNAASLIAEQGSAAQIERFAADAAAGRLFAVWNTEAADGVRIEADAPGRHRLRGCKTFASGAGHVARAIVTARDANGRSQMVVVDTERTPPAIDRSFWRPLGMRPTASYKVDFDAIVVADDALLGAPDGYLREPAFSAGAVRFSAVQVGGVEAVFDETRAFLKSLGRAADPYQRARLGEMAMRVASARQWLHGAALNAPPSALETLVTPGRGGAAGRPAPTSDAGIAYAHLMRSAVEDIALRVLALAERSVGARGLLQPAPFERLHRDLTHYLRQANPDGAIAQAGAHVLARAEAAHDLWQE